MAACLCGAEESHAGVVQAGLITARRPPVRLGGQANTGCYFAIAFAAVFFFATLVEVEGLAAAFTNAAALRASACIRAAVTALRFARVLAVALAFVAGFLLPLRIRARLVVMSIGFRER